MSTVNPLTGQGIQTQPENLTGDWNIDWSQPQQALEQKVPILAGFVPAFMEVYGDLLKGMTPHEVGSLASQVFLKMR